MKHIFLLKDIKKHHDFAIKINEIMHGYDYELIYSHSAVEMQNHVQKLTTPCRLYVVGGDGTIHNLIQVLVHTHHEMVILPLGTGNDFARCLTKEKNLYQILKQSLHKKAKPIDTILMNERYYINAACFGLDSVIANHVHDTPNIPLVPESQSYIISILQHIFQYNFHHVKVISKGKCLYDGPVTLCTLNNGQYYGGGFQITPESRFDDGWIDVCIADKVPKRKMPYFISLLVAHKIAHRPEIHYFKVKEADIICDYECNLDGEIYKNTHYHVEIQPLSILLVY